MRSPYPLHARPRRRFHIDNYTDKAARPFGMQFRVSWRWNVVAGDPYYAPDCREDD